ncbi:MAG: DUF4058 family protein [Planctomycetes bacterium]|nr:DUF4058 family protein [Planctomycetota bacterium]
MPSPFPGMDPWLEQPGYWIDVHNSFITYLRDDLNEALGGRYFAQAGERVVIEDRDELRRGVFPDLTLVRMRSGEEAGVAVAERATPVRVKAKELTSEFREAYLEILDRTGEKVVTVIELLSPSNKADGADGRAKYRQKQQEILRSNVNLVEIDLLRGGSWTVAIREGTARDGRRFHYLVSVSRPADRTEFDLYPILLSDRLPVIGIPLKAGDDDALADLQSLVGRCYDRGQYGARIEYRKGPWPPFSDLEAAWAAGLLQGAGVRR